MPRNRKSASSIEDLVSQLDAGQRAIVKELRALVKKADPQATEALKWSMPVFEHDGLLCYIAPMSSTVNFGFYGECKELDDPDKLLEGTGKRMRHVKIRHTDEIRTALFTKWVKKAAAMNVAKAKSKS